MKIAERIWAIVHRWDYFAKDTLGKQLARSADSISANISEGFGRYYYGENRQFCFYARGSLYETKTWLEKAKQRNLIVDADAKALQHDLDQAARMLNAYIRSIGASDQ
jgi:four helix bundle protein